LVPIRWTVGILFELIFVAGNAGAQIPSDSTSRWSLDFRYGYTESETAAATLPMTPSVPGRYVELAFLPTGVAEYGVAYAFARESSTLFLAGVAVQSFFTSLDVSDSSFQSFEQGTYPIATLRVSQLKISFQVRSYSDLPLGLGIGMWHGGLGVTCAWASSVNVLDQAKSFPGIQSIEPHASWLLGLDGGIGYHLSGSPLTLTANFTLNFQMEFAPNDDFLEIVMTPGSAYEFKSSAISPVYLSIGLIVDL
jgi:hypothetical protein